MLELGNTATEYEKYTVYGVGDKTNTDYEPYGYKIPLVNSGKNLLPYPFYQTTKTTNGVTFTDNGDGSITINGTATNTIYYHLAPVDGANVLKLPAEKYYFYDNCDNTSSPCRFAIQAKKRDNGEWVNLLSIGNGNGVFDITNIQYDCIWVVIVISSGDTLDNVTFKPQIELGNTATDYEPYRAPDTTNVYHTAPLKDGESISYKADGLPELQLYKGENNITADTAVAPSAIDIKYLN